jgi:hypothetical protein
MTKQGTHTPGNHPGHAWGALLVGSCLLLCKHVLLMSVCAHPAMCMHTTFLNCVCSYRQSLHPITVKPIQ